MQARLMLLLAALAAGPAHADPARDALEEIAKCADVVDAAERLKCFDAAMPRAKSALAAPAPAPTPAPETASKGGLLEWFGLSRPPKPVTKQEDFGKAPKPAEPAELNEITATVTEFAKTARGN